MLYFFKEWPKAQGRMGNRAAGSWSVKQSKWTYLIHNTYKRLSPSGGWWASCHPHQSFWCLASVSCLLYRAQCEWSCSLNQPVDNREYQGSSSCSYSSSGLQLRKKLTLYHHRPCPCCCRRRRRNRRHHHQHKDAEQDTNGKSKNKVKRPHERWYGERNIEKVCWDIREGLMGWKTKMKQGLLWNGLVVRRINGQWWKSS